MRLGGELTRTRNNREPLENPGRYKPLTGHTNWVTSVAVGRLGGRDVIVSGSYDDTVRLWDAAGQPIGEPLDLMEAVGALTLSRGRLLVATRIALISFASVGATIRPTPRNDR